MSKWTKHITPIYFFCHSSFSFRRISINAVNVTLLLSTTTKQIIFCSTMYLILLYDSKSNYFNKQSQKQLQRSSIMSDPSCTKRATSTRHSMWRRLDTRREAQLSGSESSQAWSRPFPSPTQWSLPRQTTWNRFVSEMQKKGQKVRCRPWRWPPTTFLMFRSTEDLWSIYKDRS